MFSIMVIYDDICVLRLYIQYDGDIFWLNGIELRFTLITGFEPQTSGELNGLN
jgi:hypothetical protein